MKVCVLGDQVHCDQGGQVPLTHHAPGGNAWQGGGCSLNYQVPDEEGAVPVNMCGPCQHDAFHQLPGVPAEEELAERACPVHQEHHGPRTADLLDLTLAGSAVSVCWASGDGVCLSSNRG